jgi:hypothetical protein
VGSLRYPWEACRRWGIIRRLRFSWPLACIGLVRNGACRKEPIFGDRLPDLPSGPRGTSKRRIMCWLSSLSPSRMPEQTSAFSECLVTHCNRYHADMQCLLTICSAHCGLHTVALVLVPDQVSFLKPLSIKRRILWRRNDDW